MDQNKKQFTPKPFGPFYLLDLIAVGGMAEIYAVLPIHTEVITPKPSALKKLLPRYSGNRASVSMLIDEAKITSLIDHPNVVRILDLGSAEGSFYVQMELVYGQSLDKLINKLNEKGEKIPLPVFKYILKNICNGLHAAHTLKDADGRPLSIIHRDITPGNILLSYDGDVKLTDFGIATAEKGKDKTEVKIALGKLSYMSPEQAERKQLSQQTDIYSLGAVLFELLTGEKLFSGKTELEIINEIKAGAKKRFHVVNNLKIPEIWKDALKACLARNPKDRPESALEIYEMFKGEDISSKEETATYLSNFFKEEKEEQDAKIASGIAARESWLKSGEAKKHIEMSAIKGKTDVIEKMPFQQPTQYRPIGKIDLKKKEIKKKSDNKKEPRAKPALTDPKQLAPLPEGDKVSPASEEEQKEDLSIFQPVGDKEKTELFIRQKEEISEVTDKEEKDVTMLYQRPGGEVEEIKPSENPPEIIDKKSSDFGEVTDPTLNTEESFEPSEEYFEETSPSQKHKMESSEDDEIRSFLKPGVLIKKINILHNTALMWGLISASIILMLMWWYVSISPTKKADDTFITLPINRPAIVELRMYAESQSTAKHRSFFDILLGKKRSSMYQNILDVEKLFEREYALITRKTRKIIAFKITPIKEIPVSPPKTDGVLGNNTVIGFFSMFPDNSSPKNKPDAVINIFFYKSDPLKVNPYPPEHMGKRERGKGVIFFPINKMEINYSLFMLARETARIFGASDKTDSGNIPIFPEGYYDPTATPLYPQKKAELMGLGIPLSPTTTAAPTSLKDVGIGIKTAYELNWIDYNTMTKYYSKIAAKN